MEIMFAYSLTLFLPSTFFIILMALCCWGKALVAVGLQEQLL